MRIEDSNDGSGIMVDLNNIKMPFLNVVAEKDDLVAPSSSKALNNALKESNDKSLIEHNSGHVGLMIGKKCSQRTLAKSRSVVEKAIITLSLGE